MGFMLIYDEAEDSHWFRADIRRGIVEDDADIVIDDSREM